VTYATTSLVQYHAETGGTNMVYGLSTTIRTGSENVMEKGSVVQEVSGLHVVVGRSNPKGGVSVSTQVAVLRRLLLGWEKGDTQTVGCFHFVLLARC
jgi:hypothetical protein